MAGAIFNGSQRLQQSLTLAVMSRAAIADAPYDHWALFTPGRGQG